MTMQAIKGRRSEGSCVPQGDSCDAPGCKWAVICRAQDRRVGQQQAHDAGDHEAELKLGVVQVRERQHLARLACPEGKN